VRVQMHQWKLAHVKARPVEVEVDGFGYCIVDSCMLQLAGQHMGTAASKSNV
jgi:hypothetical protein